MELVERVNDIIQLNEILPNSQKIIFTNQSLELSKLLGFDRTSLETTNKQLNDYFLSLNTPHIEWTNKRGGKYVPCYTSIKQYAPSINLMNFLFKGDFTEKTVVEVGAERLGIVVLGYLNSLGAIVSGVDYTIVPPKEMLDKTGINFINKGAFGNKGGWADISKHFEPESVDVINVAFMVTNPEAEMKGVSAKDYRVHIEREMYKVLKKNGVFILTEVGCYANPNYTLDEFSADNLKMENFEKFKFVPGMFAKQVTVYQKFN